MGQTKPITDPEELLRGIVACLVDDQDQVLIDIKSSKRGVMYEIEVADGDVGKLLGRSGKHADALRTLFIAIYGKLGKKLLLEVIDPRS